MTCCPVWSRRPDRAALQTGNVYYCYVIRSPRRDVLAAHLAKQGIDNRRALPNSDAPATGLP